LRNRPRTGWFRLPRIESPTPAPAGRAVWPITIVRSIPHGGSMDTTPGMPPAPENPSPTTPGVQCLRCEGTGNLLTACDRCGGQGSMVVSCRKCSGKGTYAQKAGPCARCEAKGILADGAKCPRCKGHKVQIAFSSPCAKCAGTGSLTVPCKRCNGTLQYQADCPNCKGTGIFRRE